jgi:hypothetical protein
MIVTLMDGKTLRTTISDCTGYVAKRIEIEPKDCRIVLELLARNDIETLRPMFAQLQYRFPEMREPFSPRPYQRAALDALLPTGGGQAVEWKMGQRTGKTRAIEEITAAYAKQGFRVYRYKDFSDYSPSDVEERAPAPDKKWRKFVWHWALFWFVLGFIFI